MYSNLTNLFFHIFLILLAKSRKSHINAHSVPNPSQHQAISNRICTYIRVHGLSNVASVQEAFQNTRISKIISSCIPVSFTLFVAKYSNRFFQFANKSDAKKCNIPHDLMLNKYVYKYKCIRNESINHTYSIFVVILIILVLFFFDSFFPYLVSGF